MWTETVSRGQLFAALRESIHALKLPECLVRLEILERSWRGLLHAKRSPSAEHVRLYGAHGGVKCPPFATEFGQRHSFSKVQDLADIQGCFAAFGVSLPSDAADRPDHVSFLLDFLSFLCVRQVHAISEHNSQGAALDAKVERDIFRKWIFTWIPTFCKAVAAQSELAFYHDLAELTAAFVESEAQRLDIQIDPGEIEDYPDLPDDFPCIACANS